MVAAVEMKMRVNTFSGRDALEAIGSGRLDQHLPAAGIALRWLAALTRGLQYKPYVILAERAGQPVGLLPLAFVKSLVFGRFLVSLPYINSSGVFASDPDAARALVDEAVSLADALDVRYLELRHEVAHVHPSLNEQLTSKAHLRMPLPESSEQLMAGFKSKLRSQIRNAQKRELTVHWGREELLADFYTVFARNMRDLGTPVYGQRLFTSILDHFADDSELCVVRTGGTAIAAALLVHGRQSTEVPSASSLREYNSTNANMLMYYHLLCRAIERGQPVFDFGRCTLEGPHYKFKVQWGAQPEPAVWQYYVRKGSVTDMRPENSKYQRAIRVWQRLPLTFTRAVGPFIVRGIP